MPDSGSANTITRERVDNLASVNSEPDWFKAARLAAWEQYLQVPAPSRRDDEWRKIDIDVLDLSRLNALNVASGSAASAVKLPKWLEPGLKSFPNAHVLGEFGLTSPSPELPQELKQKGVIFCTWKEALRRHADLIRQFLERPVEPDKDGKFGLMNKALFDSGVFLYVPANLELDDPFLSVIHLAVPGSLEDEKGAFVFPRVLAVIGANSRVSLVNIFSSETPQVAPKEAKGHPAYSLSDTLVEVHVGDGAILRYVELQKYAKEVFVVTKTQCEVGKDGQFFSLTAGLGGGQLKSEIVTSLNASGASSDVEGVVFGEASEHFNFNTIQEHNAPDTRSNINFRVALKDNASSVYQGIIKVAKEAQKTDAYQSNKNLLLGGEARADSIPKLEILADDVKCSHGATVGPVDREQVFYLMSRGLTATEAEELIVTGFFAQVLHACTVAGAADWITRLVTDKIHRI